jgi:hypothetical protein
MANVPMNIGQSTQPGRPKMPKPIIGRVNDNNAGFDWASKSAKPEAIERVYTGYMKKNELPPGFKPQGVMMNSPQEALRRRSISRGWAEKKAALTK